MQLFCDYGIDEKGQKRFFLKKMMRMFSTAATGRTFTRRSSGQRREKMRQLFQQHESISEQYGQVQTLLQLPQTQVHVVAGPSSTLSSLQIEQLLQQQKQFMEQYKQVQEIFPRLKSKQEKEQKEEPLTFGEKVLGGAALLSIVTLIYICMQPTSHYSDDPPGYDDDD